MATIPEETSFKRRHSDKPGSTEYTHRRTSDAKAAEQHMHGRLLEAERKIADLLTLGTHRRLDDPEGCIVTHERVNDLQQDVRGLQQSVSALVTAMHTSKLSQDALVVSQAAMVDEAVKDREQIRRLMISIDADAEARKILAEVADRYTEDGAFWAKIIRIDQRLRILSGPILLVAIVLGSAWAYIVHWGSK